MAEDGGEVIGWAALSAWNKRCGYATTVEWSVYIRHDWQRKGVASVLLKELIELAKAVGHHTIIGGVSGDQTPSLEFHRRHGFEQVAHFRETGYKFGQWLDVVYLQLMID